VLDLGLIIALGFFGSFGHCIGMCGPLTVAFSLSRSDQTPKINPFHFHLLLNLGRIVSYSLIGAILGSLGSVIIASGQLAGIGSEFRQIMAFMTGLLLIWFGLVQIKPDFLPHLPILHPIQGVLHRRLSSAMTSVSFAAKWWTPALLGLIWGLIPCGFLYAAQIKAAETGSLSMGAFIMLAFGLGTSPMMLGVGISASRLSASRRSQLFRLGGWITLTIGILTLLRTDAMIDYTGHGSFLLLSLALIARPLSGFCPNLLVYRRAIGVGAFVLALAHLAHILEHSFQWNIRAIFFMLPQYQLGIITGIIALILITPAAVTSFDYWQKKLGKKWRLIHLLSVPALILATIHIVLSGSHYLGKLNFTWHNQAYSLFIILITLAVLILRTKLFWLIFALEKAYISPNNKQ
jgi:sulfite exporter TauE/SafE